MTDTNQTQGSVASNGSSRASTSLFGDRSSAFRRWFGSADATEPEEDGGADDDAYGREADPYGLHEVTKKTGYWFNMELAGLENAAREFAASWGEKGLPHHLVVPPKPLPVEETLAGRAVEILRQWADRVRTKVQDAIETAGREMNDAVASTRTHLRQLESTHLELKNREREAADLKDALRDKAAPFGYRAFLSNGKKRSLLVFLVAVEFIANFPIFRLLLPMNPALSEVARMQAEQAADRGWWSGPAHFVQDLLLRPEALVLSFVVVAIMIFLGDTFGESFRPVLALRPEENGGAELGIRSHRRQHLFRAGGSLIGVVAALAFLYAARNQIPETARTRFARDSTTVQRLNGELADAVTRGSTADAPVVQQNLDDAKRDLEIHNEELSYALTVQRSNLAILFLNVALLFAAGVAGYSAAKEDLSDRISEDPRYRSLRETVEQLKRETLGHRQAYSDAQAKAVSAGARVSHLVSSRPLREWRAKAERLQGVIPLFRAENARLRMLDPSDIAAFTQPPPLQLPSIDEESLRPPANLDANIRELESFKARFDALHLQPTTGAA